MKFNTISNFLKKTITINWLKLLGCSTLILAIVGLCSRACTSQALAAQKREHQAEILQYENTINSLTQELLALRGEEIVTSPIADKMIEKRKEHPVATKIWEFLGAYGYNDYVKAGILGNIMAEAGGQSLNINPLIYSNAGSGYYGICQWSLYYVPQIRGLGLEEQLKYLISSIRYEFNTFGKNYRINFNYDEFIQIQNEKDAALAFAKCYERCGLGSYAVRQKNATIAYQYFTS